MNDNIFLCAMFLCAIALNLKLDCTRNFKNLMRGKIEGVMFSMEFIFHTKHKMMIQGSYGSL